MNRSAILSVITALLILLFLYTGIQKMIGRTTFYLSMTSIAPLKPYASFISYAIPLVEMLTAALLFFPKTKPLGLIISTALMFLFSVYIGLMLAFAKHRPCSCGGVISSLTWPQHLAFNILFLVLSFSGIVLQKSSKHRLSL